MKELELIYPAVQTCEVDVLAADGALPVGCFLRGGAITPFLSPVKTGSCPENVTAVWYAEAAKRFLLYADGTVYTSSDGLYAVSLADLAAQSPFVFEERGEEGLCAYVAGDGTCIVHTGTSQTSCAFAGGIAAGVCKNGRLFGVDSGDGLLVRWSGEGGGLDWEEGISGAGWAYLDAEGGSVRQLVVFKDKLVAVREYALTVLSAYGTPENFRVTGDGTPTPHIYAGSAAVAGEKLYFATEDGIYAFDGSSAAKVTHALAGEISAPTRAAAYGGYYLLCCTSGTLGRQAVFALDTGGGAACLVDAEADVLCVHDGVYAYGNGADCRLGEDAFTFYSGRLDFGTPQGKVLTRLDVAAAQPVDITVSNGVQSRTFACVNGKVRLNMRGRVFRVTVSGGAAVYAVKAYAEVGDGV